MSGGELPTEEPGERPTIPVPRESGVQLRTLKVAYAAATVDVVLCDLSKDPRSEDFVVAPSRSWLCPDTP